MRDVAFQMPTLEGMGVPPETRDAFGDVGGALGQTFEQINRELKALRMVNMSGRGKVPIDRALEESGLKSGDYLWTTQSRAQIRLRRGWVLADGNNGTMPMQGKYAKGASVDSHVGATAASTMCHDHTISEDASDNVNVNEEGCAPVSVAAPSHKHNSTASSETPEPPHGLGWWIMKL